MKAKTERSQRLLACIGNASRWRVVAALAGGEHCVTELASRIRLSQSCTTRHLQALVREGVVRRARDGKRVLFALRLEDPKVHELLAWALPGVEAGRPVSEQRAGGTPRRAAARQAAGGPAKARRAVRRSDDPEAARPRAEPAVEDARVDARPHAATAEEDDEPVNGQTDAGHDDIEDWLL